MDETWSVFDVGTADITPKVFKKHYIPEFYIKNDVHKDIKESLRLVEKLIEHSYYEYQFYDIAALKICLTFEMALRIRYKEETGKEWDQRKKLIHMIAWFQQNNYFEVSNDEYLNSVRIVRNVLAHPVDHSFSGPHSRHFIENILDLINGLYEIRTLRKQRMQVTRSITKQLAKFKKRFKCTIDDKVFYAFNAWVGFVNNKLKPHEVTLYFNPTFNPKRFLEAGQNRIDPLTLAFTGKLATLSSALIKLKTKEGSILTVTPFQNADEKKILDDWCDKYEKYCPLALGYFLINGKETDTFSYHLRQFHKL